MKIAGALRRFWESRSLRARLVALMLTLLTAGLAMSGTLMIGLLQRHLVAQVDDQLSATAASFANSDSSSLSGALLDSGLPSLYYIRITRLGDDSITILSNATREHAGQPLIPSLLSVGERADTDSGWTEPVTVSSTKAGSPWRAIMIPMAPNASGTPTALMTIALPLADVQHTIRNMADYVATASIVIIVIGTAAGTYLVRRALSPLREIEYTAGKIAAGDLTQRVAPAPPSTEVGSLALSLNTMLSQVEHSFAAREESERKIKRFVSDASHELRTPLAAISGYCELYAMGGVPADRTSDVMGRIQSESTRMSSLVEDLLTLARLDEGRPLDIIDVDLMKLLDNATFDLQALDPERTVQIVPLSGRAKAPATLLVRADRDRLQQVFTNLIGNIIRYTPNSTPVELAAGRTDSAAVIEFRDHGPGIDQEDRSRVFERFYRAESSRARSLGGSGLGLAIVSGILQAHRGQVSLSKTSGGGLTVHIELPLHLDALAAAPLPSGAPAPDTLT